MTRTPVTERQERHGFITPDVAVFTTPLWMPSPGHLLQTFAAGQDVKQTLVGDFVCTAVHKAET